MFDSFNRRINYLRISVTDRCNLRCTYCMPEDGIQLMSHDEILSFEEIRDFVAAATSFGIDKVRITGGEPLARKGIAELVRMIHEIDGINEISITTNGILLKKFAKELYDAGIKRVNISLDTMDPDKYSKITRIGKLQDVLDGIDAAKKAGMHPIKINCVIEKSNQEMDAQNVKAFCVENDLQIRFIHLMNLETGDFSVVEGGDGGHCSTCNRLRLTANGKLKPCLFDQYEYDIRSLGNKIALEKAIGNKPECGTANTANEFYNIGG